MNKILTYLSLFVLAVLVNIPVYAQDKSGFDEAMRGNGKIYVVVAICLTILIGLFLYVFVIDRKLSRMEKDLK